MSHPFPLRTVESADARLVGTLKHIQGDAPTLPDPVARIANSPENLKGFLAAHAQFERSSLGAVEREIVTMVVALSNGCRVCTAMHSLILDRLSDDAGATTRSLRDGRPLADPRHEALRRFTEAVLRSRGEVRPEELTAFLDHGYTGQAALDVVLGVGTSMISTFTNRLIEVAG